MQHKKKDLIYRGSEQKDKLKTLHFSISVKKKKNHNLEDIKVGGEEKEWQMFSMADWFRRKPDAEMHKQEISTLGTVVLNRTKTSNSACFLTILKINISS